MKQIELTQGQYALVDDADYDWLSKYKWYARERCCSENFDAIRNSKVKNGKRHLISMARQILGLKSGDKRQADHINHNTSDNRRENLRICTRQQNQMNRKPAKNKSSKFKGVSWLGEIRGIRKWHATIRINGRLKNLGRFSTEKSAAQAYNLAAKRYFGNFAYLNKIA